MSDIDLTPRFRAGDRVCDPMTGEYGVVVLTSDSPFASFVSLIWDGAEHATTVFASRVVTVQRYHSPILVAALALLTTAVILGVCLQMALSR